MTTRFGELDCHLHGELSQAKGLLVLCHGFGAQGDDLVALGDALHRQREQIGLTEPVVFPVAPIDLGARYRGGRAWWHVEVGRFARARTADDMNELAAPEPDGLGDARAKLEVTLAELQAKTGLPRERILLGGFSQGAMLATDVALRAEKAPAALCVFSGALVSRNAWAAHAPRRAGLPVLQTHGTRDPVLPFSLGSALRDFLREAGLDVNFSSFAGPHTIVREGIVQLAKLAGEVFG